MISLDEALQSIRDCLRVPESENVTLAAAHGRILPQPVFSRFNQPPFDKAAMDGWVWLAAPGQALPEQPLKAVATVAAGKAAVAADGRAAGVLRPGMAMRIMTGAALPAWSAELLTAADSVGPAVDEPASISLDAGGRRTAAAGKAAGNDVTGNEAAGLQPRIQRFEWSEEKDGLVFFSRKESERNIIYCGENIRAGDCLLEPGLLKAQDIGMLAADGRSEIELARRLKVGVVSTGTELVDAAATQELGANQIYDSNRPQLLAQLSGFPCELTDYGIVSDDYEQTKTLLRTALLDNDLLVLSGGVSMGDFDYVPKALQELGVQTVFHGVAMKPGKPTYFGRLGTVRLETAPTGASAPTRDGLAAAGRCSTTPDGVSAAVSPDRYAIGLPGNPVSVFVNTEVLVKPLLAALSGLDLPAPVVQVPLVTAMRRRNAERAEFLPVRCVPGGVEAVPYGGSSALQALAAADGFVVLPAACAEIKEGELADVRFVR